jgi:hypothetical protein
MKISRLIGAILAAVFAVGLVMAAAASAAAPEFSPGSGTLSTTSNAGTLEASLGEEKIYCTGDKSVGTITGVHTVGSVVVTFTGCKGKKGKEECEAHSTGKTNEIVTNTLKGELGTVATSEAASGVALLLEPASGTAFVTTEGSCLTTAAVSGKIAGEATPIKSKSTTGKLIFVGSAGAQKITKVNVLSAEVEPKLTAFAGLVSASEATSEEVKFSQVIEVT